MARNVLQMDVDASKALKKLNRLRHKFIREGKLSVQDAGELGKQRARLEAPYYSGKTFRLIKLMKGSSENEAIIMAQNPTPNKTWGGGKFNLVRWMHESPKADDHIKSGNPRFMDAAYDYLRKVAPNTVRQRFDKIITQENAR